MSNPTADIAALTTLTFTINDVKTPPSLDQMSGFTVQTYNSLSNLIDQSSSTITYSVTTAGTIPLAYISLSSTTSVINKQTRLTMTLRNSIPLPAKSKIRILIPSAFQTTSLTKVSGDGSRIVANPSVTFSNSNYQIDITDFNNMYLESQVNLGIYLDQLILPSSSAETTSFQVTFFNANGFEVEKLIAGKTFQATPSQISSVTISPSIKYLNYSPVQYTFTFTPLDPFTNQAKIKITFPSSIQISNRVNQKLTSYNALINPNALVTVTSNQYVVISNVILVDYTTSQGALSVTVDGVSNPDILQSSNQFGIEIFYTENTNVVSQFLTTQTILTEANPNAMMYVYSTYNYTGYITTLNFKIDMTGYSIVKGSYFRVTIPSQYQIFDMTSAQNSCIKDFGFLDEISCTLSELSNGFELLVKNGLNSGKFSGGVLSFNITNIVNYNISTETDTFGLQIKSSDDQLLYSMERNVILEIDGAPFSYSLITSNNPKNSQSSEYVFTLTLSVDTDANSILQIIIPDDITVDTSKSFTCSPLQYLKEKFKCELKEKNIILVTLTPTNRREYVIASGTTISFKIGYLINPISLKESESFIISTIYDYGSSFRYQYYNRQTQNLTIQNSEKGTIKDLDIKQIGSKELRAITSLKFTFKTTKTVPNGAQISVSIPNEMYVVPFNISSVVNNITVSSYFDELTRDVKIPIVNMEASEFEIIIKDGIYNPFQGPYSLSNFLVDVETSDGYTIDSISSVDIWVQVNCSSKCATCQRSLAQCTSCGYNEILKKSFYLENGDCVEQCQSGYYGASDFTCQKCQYPCEECQFQANLCTKCSSFFDKPYANPLTLTCYAECPSGTYLDIEQKLCLKCQEPCYTCSSKSDCLSCDTIDQTNLFVNYYQNTSRCYNQCPDGTVATPGKKCIECNSPCSKCSETPDLCTQCMDDKFALLGSCYEKCPKNYLENIKEMTCEYKGELGLPVPFSIVAALVSIGLLIARFMKNSTRLFISILAILSLLLVINWVILGVYLFIAEFYVSAAIIIYCLFASLLINLLAWRRLYFKYQIVQDPFFYAYTQKYPIAAKVLTVLSFIVSFHIFRLTYCRLFGKQVFSASFQNHDKYYQLVGRLTIFTVFVIYVPALFANCYNMFYTQPKGQIFYLDLDSLILVVYTCIIIGVVIGQKERMVINTTQFNVKEIIGIQDDDDNPQEQNNLKEMRKKLSGFHRLGQETSRTQELNITDFSNIQNTIENNLEQDLALLQLQEQQRIYQSQFHGSDQQPKKQEHQFYSDDKMTLEAQEIAKMKESFTQSAKKKITAKNVSEFEQMKQDMLDQEYQMLQNINENLQSDEGNLRNKVNEEKLKLLQYQEETEKLLQEKIAMKKEQIMHRKKMKKLKFYIEQKLLSESLSKNNRSRSKKGSPEFKLGSRQNKDIDQFQGKVSESLKKKSKSKSKSKKRQKKAKKQKSRENLNVNQTFQNDNKVLDSQSMTIQDQQNLQYLDMKKQQS